MTDHDMTAQSALPVDTYGGRIHVEWDPQAAVTPLGQLPFFIEFLKTADLFAPWVRECPVTYTSPNAPEKVDLLGTLLLSVLSGHHRYAHITTIRNDGVNPALLGMRKVCSEDSVRRALRMLEPQASRQWLQTHLRRCYDPVLYEPWILDMDLTVKPLSGHQEGAEVGYNPHKPGRPSHTYHTYLNGPWCHVPAVSPHRRTQHRPRQFPEFLFRSRLIIPVGMILQCTMAVGLVCFDHGWQSGQYPESGNSRVWAV